MSNIIFTSDSTIDIGKKYEKEFGLSVVPLTVILGEQTYLDGVDIEPQQIYDYVAKTKILPKTSAVSQYDFAEFFRKVLAEHPGSEIIHFDISGELSICHTNAVNAAKDISEKEGKVYVIDGRVLSTGTALLFLKARDLVAEGKSAAEIVEIINGIAQANKGQTSFVVDTLDYLYKGGRCSGLTLMGARFLSIHPILNMDNGFLKPAAQKLKGRMSMAIPKYIEYLAERHKDPDTTRCFVTHTAGMDEEWVQSAIQKTKELFSFKEIIRTQAGCTVHSHCGPGTIGLLFLNR